MAGEEQEEELQALHAIFNEDITEISGNPPCFMIKLTDITVNLPGPVSIRLTMPLGYPGTSPPIIEVPMRNKVLSDKHVSDLLQYLHTVADENLGMSVIFTLVDAAQQWINTNIEEQVESSVEEVSKAQEDGNQFTKIKLTEPKVSGGRWEYKIGLIGKPSAGKSTFFNAATKMDLAKIAAHPFTTIEPNIGKAFYSICCPCHDLGLTLCDATYGHDFRGDRNIPILLKDVAGLVPGAWEGKGKGNRFLNDLLDADVLVHIVDISGTTNEKGEETEHYDPVKDVSWLYQELHQWIFQNVWSKWDNIVRKPNKLIDMFTGYHANRATIHTALANAGIKERELSCLPDWKEDTVHRIVDHFLKLRFPMLLVLNKADLTTSESNIKRIREELPDYTMIPVSAKTECGLQKLAKDNVIQYKPGDNHFDICSDCDINTNNFIKYAQYIFSRYGSTNVLEALRLAVKLKEPVYSYPVHCLDTFHSIGKHSHNDSKVLLDCLLLKPRTTVEELYNVMMYYPLQMLTGDFVRAEACDENQKKRPVKKDEVISKSNNIIRIMTTKRS
ncbi:uncharacterized protein [Mytilus edulis]|uniref:uncharacterized protein n=1 Tax=Mytilus edulis TaxID=6550 RepID=UPI0039EF248B